MSHSKSISSCKSLAHAKCRPQTRSDQAGHANVRPIPDQPSQKLLRQTLQDVGIYIMPEMVRPKWLVGLLFASSVTFGLAAWFWSARPINSPSVLLNFLLTSPALTGFTAAIFFAWATAKLTTGMKCEFKPTMARVGGFLRWVVAHGAKTLGAPPGEWSREQVAHKVRRICIDVLSCEKVYREDADFVKDLGLS